MGVSMLFLHIFFRSLCLFMLLKSFLCAAQSFRGGREVGVKSRSKSEPMGHTACAGVSLQGKTTGRGHLVEANCTTVFFCKPGGIFLFFD